MARASGPTFQVFQPSDGSWRWRLVAGNGRVLGVGEPCKSKGAAVTSARNAANAAASAAAHRSITVVVTP